jgi:S-adenosylmethionine/arginine decarboxylase-like enzyme
MMTASPQKRSGITRKSNEINNDKKTTMKMISNRRPYHARVPLRFLVLVFISASLISFFIGKAARSYFLTQHSSGNTDNNVMDLFSTSMKQVLGGSLAGNKATIYDTDWTLNERYNENEIDKEEDNPIANHLLVDLQGLDKTFLQSEDRLKELVLSLIEEQDSFELKYFFSRSTSKHGNVVLAGISDMNRLGLRTWPSQGVALFDMFTTGPSNDFFDLVPEIERLFSIHAVNTTNNKFSIHWAHKIRGYNEMMDETDVNALADLQWFPVGLITDYKKEVRTETSPFPKEATTVVIMLCLTVCLTK